jgi:glycosyltransferase involved in cell wall biosynthesis
LWHTCFGYPVVGLVDLIKDGQNGFLVKNNTPVYIATEVIRVLEHPNTNDVIYEARTVMEDKFTFERPVERFRDIVSELA